jgi:NAD(P)-dependent dehydrogenase (short-subunit alcohol dehydrogenase family)
VGSLSSKVAVVTGASRGIGKGVALALADNGATIYVTGRTVIPGSHQLLSTVDETAAEVDRRGGKSIAVQVDHGKDDQVAVLFEQVNQEQGRLDILVNNAFALPYSLTEPEPFREKPLSYWEMVDVGVRSNYVAAWHAARIMVPQRSGLIVATSRYVGATYTYGVVFGTCKAAVDRMARDMAIELKPHSVASLSLWMGLTFTERAERALQKYPQMSAQTVTSPSVGSSIEFPGRVIAALASDPDIMTRSGGTHIAAELAGDYGVIDSTDRFRRPCAHSEAHRCTGPFSRRARRPRASFGGNMNSAPSSSADPVRLVRLEQLLDRQDILDCLTRFSRGMDRFDRELFLTAFHGDAVIAAGEFVGGPAELYDWASAMHKDGQSATHHNLLNHSCEISANVAHTETYYLFVARNRDETNWVAGGRYIDRLERRDGAWRIALRTTVIEWSGLVPTMAIPYTDVLGIDLNGAPSRNREDPSYRRPLTNKRETHIPCDPDRVS